MLRDIVDGDDPQIAAVSQVIDTIDPDILLLLGFDYDAGLVALGAFSDQLAQPFPHHFALRPNAGRPTGVDVDGDGLLGGPRDAHGYGNFSGEGGMAILSRLPIETDAAIDLSDVLWRDRNAEQAEVLLPPEAAEVLRLSTMSIWDLPVALPSGAAFHLLAIHAGAPVFDGPEDRNGIRNQEEIRLLLDQLDSHPADTQLAVMGTLNVDPDRGEGLRDALTRLLTHPALQDPMPLAPDGTTATSNWDEPSPGRLRVDYILPSASLTVLDAAVHGNADDPGVAETSGHRLLWVDIQLPAQP